VIQQGQNDVLIPWDNSALTAVEKAAKAEMVLSWRKINLISVIS
jgi:ABC-type sulfate transport system substrate-binding protein